MEDMVELVCVKAGSKLRVRVTSANYLHSANVQFPRAMRAENRRFRVRSANISLIETRGKYFYSVKRAGDIEIIDGDFVPSAHAVFENADEAECVICMAAEKDTVFVPCYHYYCCSTCAQHVKACPICRAPIRGRVNKALIG